MSTGIAGLDDMLGGRGLYRGSSVLMSGTAGSGKSSISAHVINAGCARSERCLYFPSEESPQQIIRNMRSIGIDLGRWVARGLLQFHTVSPYSHGLETHLALMHRQIVEFDPRIIVMDPMSNLTDIGNPTEVKAMLARLMDFLKGRGITALFTSLTSGSDNPETTDVGVSSLMDTWLLLRNLEANGERNRGLYVLKSRGMAHSNQIREFTLSDQGAKLVDVYRGQAGVLTGTARTVQEARDHAEQVARVKKIDRKRRELERKRMSVEGQITSLLKEIEVESAELETTIAEARSAPSIFDDQRTVTAGLSSGASKRHTNVTRKGIANEPVYRVKRKNRAAAQAK
jgi:circadian clock protein KaiC